MKGHLIQIDARDGSGAVTRYLASVDSPSLCHLNSQQWVPAIAKLPSLRYDFFGGDLRSAITVPTASFSIAIEGVSSFTTLRFAGARVRIYTGNVGDAWGSFTLRFDGRISAEPTLADGIAAFEAGPDDAWLDKPLLTLFAGSGGAEGPTDLTGTVKPLALGVCRFAPGVLIDATNNIYAVSAYAVQGITAAYDRVVSLGTSTGDYANLAALIAATIANGSWGTCKALGLARLGAPADGLVSFDVSGDNAGAAGYVRKPGAMIRRIAEIAGGTVDTTNLAALDTARAYNLALVLTEQTTAREVIQQIADSVCAVAGVTWTGTLFAAPLGYVTSTQTLKSDGTALPPVASVEVKPVAAPFWRLASEAERTWVVHQGDNIASQYVLRGLYSASRVYRLDDLVESADGSAWVYINSTSGAGNAPPSWPTTSNSYWNNAAPPTNVDWANVGNAAGTRPSDSAGSNFALVAGGETSKLTITGNTITQTASSATSFNAWAYTEQSLTGTALVSAKITAGASNDGPIIGLASPANKNLTNYTSIDYAIYRGPSQYYAFESGVQTGLGGASPADSDVLSIFYDGVNVNYVRTTSAGVTVMRTVAATTGLSFHAKAIFNALGSAVSTVMSSIQFMPYTDNNFASQGGATKPENNADVTLLVTGTKTVSVAYDYTGTVKSGQLPVDVVFKLANLAATDLTASASWAGVLKSGTATFTPTVGTPNATGVLNVTALSSDAVIEMQATYGGKVSKGTATLVKNTDAPPVGGAGTGGSGTSASTSTISSTTSSSYGSANTSILSVQAGAAGQVACAFADSFLKATIGTGRCHGKWQWRVVAGVFADITTEIASDADATKAGAPDYESTAGDLLCSMTKTGLTNGTTYEFQLLLRSDGSYTLNHYGTASATGS